MRRVLPWLLALGCALVGTAVWLYRANRGVSAEPRLQPQKVLHRVLTQGHDVWMSGTETVTMRDPRGRVVHLTAKVLRGPGHRMRIEYLTPPLQGVTIWEDGERTSRFNPSEKRLTVSPARHRADDRGQREDLLTRNYDLSIPGSARVAGRDAIVLELRPKSGGPRWRKIWVDPSTWAVLGSEEGRGPREVERRTRFTEVRYLDREHEPTSTAFDPPEDLVRRYNRPHAGDVSSRFDPKTLSSLVGFEVKEPTWLPHGYVLNGAYETRTVCKRHHVAARLEYSDGLNTITLFEAEKPAGEGAGNCFSAEGQTAMAVEAEHGRWSYLAVGDVARRDLERMVHSIDEQPAP